MSKIVLFLDGPWKGQVRTVCDSDSHIEFIRPGHTDHLHIDFSYGGYMGVPYTEQRLSYAKGLYTLEKIKDRDGHPFWVGVSETSTQMRDLLLAAVAKDV